jgi:hypothetical protein
LKFNDGKKSSSAISIQGDISIPVISLDFFFSDKPRELQPTFIKLDIEGAEKAALLGAKNIIKQYRPKLAICAYHKFDDFFELPKTIIEINSEYKIYLKQYGRKYDSIIYAV